MVKFLPGTKMAVWSQQNPASTGGSVEKGSTNCHVAALSAERAAYQFPVKNTSASWAARLGSPTVDVCPPVSALFRATFRKNTTGLAIRHLATPPFRRPTRSEV